MNDLVIRLPLIIFAVFLIIYLINALFIVYHLLRFGLDYKTRVLAVIFSSGLILLIFISYRLFSKIEWTKFIYDYLSFSKII